MFEQRLDTAEVTVVEGVVGVNRFEHSVPAPVLIGKPMSDHMLPDAEPVIKPAVPPGCMIFEPVLPPGCVILPMLVPPTIGLPPAPGVGSARRDIRTGSRLLDVACGSARLIDGAHRTACLNDVPGGITNSSERVPAYVLS